MSALGRQAGFEMVDLSTVAFTPELVESVDANTARIFGVRARPPGTREADRRDREPAERDGPRRPALPDRRRRGGRARVRGAGQGGHRQALRGRRLRALVPRRGGHGDGVAQGVGPRRRHRPRGRRGDGELGARHQAAPVHPVPGDPRPRVRHPPRAVRRRLQDPLPRGRRAVRARGPARAPRPRAHQPREGHGGPRHRRDAHAAGRAHRDRHRRPLGRPARQHAADDVRRVVRDARARPRRRVARPDADRPARGRDGLAQAPASRCPTASCS